MNTVVLISENFYIRNKVQSFCKTYNYDLIKMFANSKNALEYFWVCEPDFVIVDFMLYGFDGLEFLKIVKDEFNFRSIFLCSNNFTEISQKALEFGACSVLDHEFDLDVLNKTLKQKSFEHTKVFNQNFDLENFVAEICLNVGIEPRHLGYKYLIEAITLMVKQPQEYKLVTKQLYPKIAEKYHSDDKKVERAMRHALSFFDFHKLFNVEDVLNLKSFFKTERITNSQFITIVSDRILHKINLCF